MRKVSELAWAARLPSAKLSGFGMRIISLLDVQNARKPHQLDSEETDATRLALPQTCSTLMSPPLLTGAKLGAWRVFALCLWGHVGLRSPLRSLPSCVSRSSG